MNSNLAFLDGWKIELSKLPHYEHFKGEFIEALDYHLLQLIYDSDFLETRPEIKANLKNLLENINKKTGELKVHHNQRFKCGRFYADQSISLIPLSKHIKHTVFKFLRWLDIDMVKGHPSIAIEMGKLIGQSFPAFGNYVNNFENICKTLSEFYSVEGEEPLDKDNIKWLFNSMIYGGGFNNWVKNIMKGDETYNGKKMKNENVIHDIIKDFKNECMFIANKIYKDNPSLSKKVADKKEDLYGKKCSTCSYWFQIIENHIVYIVAEFLLDRKILKPKRFGEEYDGLNIPPCNISNKDELINDINALVKLKTGMDIKFKFKDYDEKYILQDIILKRENLVIEPIIETDVEVEDSKHWKKIFQTLVVDFEKTHAKIINKAVFVKEDDNEIIIHSKNQIHTAYEHVQCGFSNGGLPVLFIDKWLKFNDKIRKYDDMQIYPNSKLCPKNIFNMWIPFKCELYKHSYEQRKEELEFILNHIKVLCNYEEEVYDYFIKWIAQMIQFPEIKSIVPTLISKQGAGKGTFLKLMTLMLGDKKVLETRDPNRDVWGNFNGIMTNAFLVNLNELCKKDTVDAEGRIKGLITDPTLTINNKGVNQFNIHSYHRFIITTNKEDPIKTSDDDRRNLIIRCSDDKIGDNEYFDKINKYLDNEEVIRTCYDYFKSVEISKDGVLPRIPKTEYQNNLKELSRTPIELWLEDFTLQHINEEKVELLGKDIFILFESWKKENNVAYDTTPLKLGISLSNLQTKGGIIKGRHTKHGETKFFNIPILKTHFKIQCLVDVESINNSNTTDDEDIDVYGDDEVLNYIKDSDAFYVQLHDGSEFIYEDVVRKNGKYYCK